MAEEKRDGGGQGGGQWVIHFINILLLLQRTAGKQIVDNLPSSSWSWLCGCFAVFRLTVWRLDEFFWGRIFSSLVAKCSLDNLQRMNVSRSPDSSMFSLQGFPQESGSIRSHTPGRAEGGANAWRWDHSGFKPRSVFFSAAKGTKEETRSLQLRQRQIES